MLNDHNVQKCTSVTSQLVYLFCSTVVLPYSWVRFWIRDRNYLLFHMPVYGVLRHQPVDLSNMAAESNHVVFPSAHLLPWELAVMLTFTSRHSWLIWNGICTFQSRKWSAAVPCQILLWNPEKRPMENMHVTSNGRATEIHFLCFRNFKGSLRP